MGSNIIFDPSKEELAVAEAVLAISAGETPSSSNSGERAGQLKLLAIRTIDPPSRLTPPGVPNSMNTATGGNAPVSSQDAVVLREGMGEKGVWCPPRGGIRRDMIGKIAKMVVEPGGVAEEVMGALVAVDT